MDIKASDVAKLRKMTGVGMMEAKGALEEAACDFDQAIEVLRKRGAAKAAKKAERETAEGRVHCYTHSNGRIGVVVEILCETDFVARNELFISFCNDLAMHIAAMSPLYLSSDEIPADVVAKETEIFKEQLLNEGKPSDMLDKIVEGKLNKWYEEVCLLNQRFIKDEDLSIEELLQQKILSIGENIKIGRFTRIQLGE
ncbi:MAG: translation elongation factor Ts [Patescibacteria group bacterium]